MKTAIMRTDQAQAQHETLIFTLAGFLARSKGCQLVQADHIKGYDQPDPIKDCIPDVLAWRWRPSISKIVTPTYICEAETGCSLRTDHTARQLTTFSAEAKRLGAEFILVIPKSAANDARDVLTQLGIRNAQILSLADG